MTDPAACLAVGLSVLARQRLFVPLQGRLWPGCGSGGIVAALALRHIIIERT